MDSHSKWGLNNIDSNNLAPSKIDVQQANVYSSGQGFNRSVTVGDFLVDYRFYNHFKGLKQVFMYITDKCNISCAQCIYKPSTNHYIVEEIPLEDALSLLRTFKELGASKVTFLGGEPTLYGKRHKSEPLFRLIEETKSIGYEYIRIDTNGQRLSHLINNDRFQMINEIAFSLDGYSSETNDFLRGEGTFDKAVENIKVAVEKGYKVTITCCVHTMLISKDDESIFLIERMIEFAESLGVEQINFHDLFKAGVPMDTWTGDFNPEPSDWLDMYGEIFSKVSSGKFDIKVRLPQCFVTEEVFHENPEYYGYCPVKLGERIMVHANGQLRICSNLICTGFATARYEERSIIWDSSNNNELSAHDLNSNTPCTNRRRHRKYGSLVPLCFSFKPSQSEHVWESKLKWDSKRASHDI